MGVGRDSSGLLISGRAEGGGGSQRKDLLTEKESRKYVELETGKNTKDKQLKSKTQKQRLTGTDRQRLVGK